MTDQHRFEGVYSYFKETDDRTDLDFISPDRPLVFTNSMRSAFSLAWRWLAGANFQNEVRGGANLAPVQFNSDWQLPGQSVHHGAQHHQSDRRKRYYERHHGIPAPGPLHEHLPGR